MTPFLKQTSICLLKFNKYFQMLDKEAGGGRIRIDNYFFNKILLKY